MSTIKADVSSGIAGKQITPSLQAHIYCNRLTGSRLYYYQYPNMADLQICRTCGAQHSSSSIDELKNECPICLDPRQYVPPTGQAWTTLSDLRSSGYKNIFHAMDAAETSTANLIGIRTEPQVAIGQTTYLVRTSEGNVLWDCISYLDDETVGAIKGLGGVKAIAISHPHFFAANVE